MTHPTYRGRETSAALQKAAREIIVRKGFLNMTISDITDEAGRSQASFYNYYTSKEDMLAQWAAEFRDEAKARSRAIPDTDDPYELVTHSVRAHWLTYKQRLAEMIGIQQFAMVSDEFAALWQEMCNDAIRVIARSVIRAQAHGYCADNDPWLLASAIVSMLNQSCYTWLVTGDQSLDAPIGDEEAIRTLADIWYRAIYGGAQTNPGTHGAP